MSYKSILVILDGTPAGEACRDLALNLARSFSAQITALALAVEPSVPAIGMHPFLLDAVDMQREASAETARSQLAEFEMAAARGAVVPVPVAIEGITAPCTIQNCCEVITHYAYCSDLVIMPRGEEALSGPGSRELMERVTLEAACPLLVVPQTAEAGENERTTVGRHIVLAWNAGREAARAVRGALPFLLSAESVRVFSVDEAFWRGDEGLAESGLEIIEYLARHGCKVTSGDVARTRQKRGEPVGHSLLAAAEYYRADLLVMGAYGHSRLRNIVLGGVTQTVFKEAKLPVLLAH